MGAWPFSALQAADAGSSTVSGGGSSDTPTATTTSTTETSPAPATAPDSAVSREDIDHLIQILQDDKARGQLIEGLRAAAGEEPAAKTEAPEPERPATRFLVSLGDAVTDIGRAVSQAGDFVRDFPRFYRWAQRRLSDPDTRDQLLLEIGQVVVILAVGAIVEFGLPLLYAGWRRRLERASPATILRRIPLAVGNTLLRLVPIIGFWVAAMAMVAAFRPDPLAVLIAVALINAHVVTAFLSLIPYFVLAPTAPGLRFARLPSPAARSLYRTISTIIAVGAFGYFAAIAMGAAGLPPHIYEFLLDVLGVVVAGLLALRVWQARPRNSIAAIEAAEPASQTAVQRSRYWIEAVWHWPVLAYIAFALLVWLIRGGNGVLFLARATASTAFIVALIAVVLLGVRQLRSRLEVRTGRIHQQNASFGGRVKLYVRLVMWLILAAVAVIAILAVAETWGVPILRWLAAIGGERIIGSLISIAIITAVGLVLWELINFGMERLIRPDDHTLEGLRKAARLRTLLPLFRQVSFGVLALFVVLISLSEIGIDIGPLIAGAGAVGVAVGFGAQAMVKDMLGGVSALVQDTMAVGDVINVAGKGGVVEWMSLRSIRLRDFDGTVHTIPFSEISIVSNSTKDFAYAVFRVNVAYDADIGEVQKIIAEIVKRMREDPAFKAKIWSDVEMLGVDSFGDLAVTVLARVKVGPGQQWDVTRRFQRLLKEEFDKDNIAMRSPARSISLPPPGQPTSESPSPEGEAPAPA
ncbi:MAG TPA: mechanosensitive ion channel domain-containing protein [Hypericibacter adhaerens]|nr:mechanosensitive ion channel domain-containing protein [Hypericibacter adhaerens]